MWLLIDIYLSTFNGNLKLSINLTYLCCDDEYFSWFNRLSLCISSRCNCWDNAVIESFFSDVKSEQIMRRIY